MMNAERLVSPHETEEEKENAMPVSLRPQSLDDFVGQRQVCENLKVFIEAAKQRGDALDHVLLFGPPGLGKTTLASIVAKELGVNFRATSAPMISKSGDLAAILTNLEKNDVLFIDEIHRLNPAIEEVLYSAMEGVSVFRCGLISIRRKNSNKLLSEGLISWVCRFPNRGRLKLPNALAVRLVLLVAYFVVCVISERFATLKAWIIKLPIMRCAVWM